MIRLDERQVRAMVSIAVEGSTQKEYGDLILGTLRKDDPYALIAAILLGDRPIEDIVSLDGRSSKVTWLRRLIREAIKSSPTFNNGFRFTDGRQEASGKYKGGGTGRIHIEDSWTFASLDRIFRLAGVPPNFPTSSDDPVFRLATELSSHDEIVLAWVWAASGELQRFVALEEPPAFVVRPESGHQPYLTLVEGLAFAYSMGWTRIEKGCSAAWLHQYLRWYRKLAPEQIGFGLYAGPALTEQIRMQELTTSDLRTLCFDWDDAVAEFANRRLLLPPGAHDWQKREWCQARITRIARILLKGSTHPSDVYALWEESEPAVRYCLESDYAPIVKIIPGNPALLCYEDGAQSRRVEMPLTPEPDWNELYAEYAGELTGEKRNRKAASGVRRRPKRAIRSNDADKVTS